MEAEESVPIEENNGDEQEFSEEEERLPQRTKEIEYSFKEYVKK